MYTLVADSGSTKTDWLLLDEEYGNSEFHTTGINPVRDSSSIITNVLMDELIPCIPSACEVSKVHFYGAGCMDPYRSELIKILKDIFPNAEITAESDLLGAARALCGKDPGIVCILGTGSNSGLYDGKHIINNISPLGFILGDEGSGAVFGRTLIGNLIKGYMPSGLLEDFLDFFHLTIPEIIDKVYRKPRPNLFLASLVPFIQHHREIPQIHDMLVSSFRQFITRNVCHYGHREMPVNFVGSIAHTFKRELSESIEAEGLILGEIIQHPIQNMAKFHQKFS